MTRSLSEAVTRAARIRVASVADTVATCPHFIEVIGGNVWHFGAKDNTLNLTIEQLAKVLSQLNRFTGHTRAKWPYTVAQHSVFVSERLDLDPTWAMLGLLHDVPEIVINDVATPMKRFLGEAAFKPFDAEEWRAMIAIRTALGLALETIDVRTEAVVKHADLIALVTEKRDLLSPSVKWNYFDEIPRYHERIVPVPAPAAARLFVRRFKQLQRRLEQ